VTGDGGPGERGRGDAGETAAPTNPFGWTDWKPGDSLSDRMSERDQRRFFADVRNERYARQPHLLAAIRADASACAAGRGERLPSTSRAGRALAMVRLLWVADAFPATVLYRVRMSLRRRRVPVLPQILHRMCMRWAQVCIGETVIIEPGLYLLHGQVVIDGYVSLGERVQIAPFVTIGLAAGNGLGPTIESDVFIGTGAKVIGPITVGRGARIAANAVVVHDVAAGVTVGGVPARVMGSGAGAAPEG
jgi:serine O-acetyltransferase